MYAAFVIYGSTIWDTLRIGNIQCTQYTQYFTNAEHAECLGHADLQAVCGIRIYIQYVLVYTVCTVYTVYTI